ncbi:hypothetical protein TNCV_3481101 [Trichonephila clavipes]|nr:hypothetical protein TNCV_3481101 [Trichonephila clavipes]
MVIRSEGAVEYVMVGVSRRPTQAIWRGKEIEPVQVIVMSFDPVKIVVASELKQFEFNGIEITGFYLPCSSKTTALNKGTHLKTTETVLAVAIDKLSSESLEFTKLRILLVLSSSFYVKGQKRQLRDRPQRLGEETVQS